MLTDTSADMAAAQVGVYRRMTPQQRIQVAWEMSESARIIAADGIGGWVSRTF